MHFTLLDVMKFFLDPRDHSVSGQNKHVVYIFIQIIYQPKL